MTRLYIGVCLGLTLSAVSAFAQDAAPTSFQHVVVSVGGTVEFRKPDWAKFAPVRFGTVLDSGDLLRFGAGASTNIVCDGFAQIASASGPGVRPVPCAAAPPGELKFRDVPVVDTAEITLPSLEPHGVVILHSAEAATKDNPVIQWPAVADADAWEVRLLGEGIDLRSKVARSQFHNYALAEDMTQALHKAGSYQLILQAMKNDRALRLSSPVANLFRAALTVSAKPEVQTIDAATSQLGKLGLSIPVATFLASRFRARNGFYDLAIAALIGIRDFLPEPALNRELGEVYSASGQQAEALSCLAQAAQEYEKAGDVVGQALTLEAQAKILLKDPAQVIAAQAPLKGAAAIYQQLGAKADETRLRTVLAGLENLR